MKPDDGKFDGEIQSSQKNGCAPENMIVRAAVQGDFPEILKLISGLELDYPLRHLPSFWVALMDGTLVAAAELKEFAGFSLLSCVGVQAELQHSGIGRAFVGALLTKSRSDIYLYTLIPGFFSKLGFVRAENTPAGLPRRSYYGCHNCEPSGCVCMVRIRNAA